jgi:predicted aspartyl protease
MIPVTFSNGEESFETMGLLDSGADFTAFTKEIAEVLGLDLSGPREKALGVGGVLETIRSKVKITVEKGHEHYNVIVPVKVLMIENSDTPPLLGREGFFDEFRITFEEQNKKIYLKKFDQTIRKQKKFRIGQ